RWRGARQGRRHRRLAVHRRHRRKRALGRRAGRADTRGDPAGRQGPRPGRRALMFAVIVARRYLLSSPGQTGLLLAGVALGVTVFVFITALVEGLAVRLTDEVTANSAHVTLQPQTRTARILEAPGLRAEGVA